MSDRLFSEPIAWLSAMDILFLQTRALLPSECPGLPHSFSISVSHCISKHCAQILEHVWFQATESKIGGKSCWKWALFI